LCLPSLAAGGGPLFALDVFNPLKLRDLSIVPTAQRTPLLL